MFILQPFFAAAGVALAALGAPEAPFPLWDERVAAPAPDTVPYLDAVTHVLVHRAGLDFRFLHGPAIVAHEGTLFASWANSPVDENSAGETMRGRRSQDGGMTWGPVEVIGPGFEGAERHSHGSFLSHRGTLWAFAARFGIGEGSVFPGLKMEAFTLDEAAGRWVSRGIATADCWPMDEPKRLPGGNWILGGVDRESYPVVALSRGDDLTRWETVRIPVPAGLALRYAETAVLVEGSEVTAIIRPLKTPAALISVSRDEGRTWSEVRASNYPMAASKPYAGVLSTGQRYLVSNLGNRDTLAIAVSRPGEKLLSRAWKIRHGRTTQPRYPGAAKGPQWSYPYAHEHDGKLYVVYSVGKEDCELSIIPLHALAAGG